MSIPFTYCIYHIPNDLHYYGCRYAKDADPEQLWKTYFTSSREVKKLIKEYGLESFIIKKIKIFKTISEARSYEHKFLKRINAAKNPKWLNKQNEDGKFLCTGHSEATKEKFRKRIPSNKGVPMSNEQKENISKKMKGRIAWNKGQPSARFSGPDNPMKNEQIKKQYSNLITGKKT